MRTLSNRHTSMQPLRDLQGAYVEDMECLKPRQPQQTRCTGSVEKVFTAGEHLRMNMNSDHPSRMAIALGFAGNMVEYSFCEGRSRLGVKPVDKVISHPCCLQISK